VSAKHSFIRLVQAESQHSLGLLYRSGDRVRGITADPALAREWFAKAADAGVLATS
jgi:TPR repeat protein